jgi:predicted DNA-binding transcriptional regulator
MVSKDQGIGGAILGVCVIVILGFLALVLFPGQIAKLLGMNTLGDTIRLDIVVVLVSIAFVAVLAIGAWIGWTMATTPPPKPIEEITTEIEDKKEEPKVEEPVKEAEAPATEDKTAKKKK